ncbi:MAG TPA: ABC transporter substrate-binding protein [Kiritimatiellia bacterium]|nr:ABC transporter substrate-binding protein [Kiritimatiellia bacterium]
MNNTVKWIAVAVCVAGLQAHAGQRVVCLGGAVTECVFALGAGDEVVAVDDSSGFPAEAAALPRVGYYRMVSAEGVLSVKPDLVLASAEAGPPPALAQIERAGVRVVRIPGAATVSGCVERVRAVGVALEQTEAAEAMATSIVSELADFPPPPGGVPARVLFVFARGAGTFNVAGTDTAADEIIRLAGGVNAVGGYSGYRPLTAEAVVESAPDVVLVTSSGLAGLGGEAALWAVPGMKATPAAKQGRAVAMDDLLLLGFGPRLPEAAKTLHQLLYR